MLRKISILLAMLLVFGSSFSPTFAVSASGNPIFSRGDEGQWDEGAIWFSTVEKINGRYYMWYEGYGGGTARTEPYGSYLKGGKSQVGMATLVAPYFYVRPDR